MEQQDRIMDGDLQTLGLQSILKMLALSGKTGKLFVHSGPETLSIGLSKGQIVALHEEGTPQLQPDLLGMLCLIHRLQLPQAQAIYEMAQGDQELTLAMLLERGWMSRQEMQQRLEFAVTQSISHALRWVNGRFAFHRHLVPLGGRMQPLDVDSVLLEALRQADEWEEIVKEGVTQLSRTTIARWQPQVSNDVRNLGLNQESIDVLCLCNGEIPLQAIALVLLSPEARVARIIARLLELNLVEVVDTAFETELQQDLANLMMRCQYILAPYRGSRVPEHLLPGLIKTLAECVNGLLMHHGRYARSLRGRGHLPPVEIVRYLESCFMQPLQLLTKQHYPILETANFVNGQLDCSDILTLNRVVKGEQLEEFYWEAVRGLGTFLRMVFERLLRDEVGNSHTGRHLNMAWKHFLSEIDGEVKNYQMVRAQRKVTMRGYDVAQPSSIGMVPTWNGAPQPEAWGNGTPEREGGPYWSVDTQRRSI
jgi:hypothetical protein